MDYSISLNGPLLSLGAVVGSDGISCTGCGCGGGEACRETSELREYLVLLARPSLDGIRNSAHPICMFCRDGRLSG